MYTYEKIFTKVYKFINEVSKVEEVEGDPEVVKEIQQLKYSRAEDELRSMFGRLEGILDDIDRQTQIKTRLEADVDRLQKIVEGRQQVLYKCAGAGEMVNRTQCLFEVKNCSNKPKISSTDVTQGAVTKAIE